MGNINRTELEQEIVDTLLETKAVNFEAIGKVIAKYGVRLAKTGTDFTAIINRNMIINCGWPIGPEFSRVQIQPTSEIKG